GSRASVQPEAECDACGKRVDMAARRSRHQTCLMVDGSAGYRRPTADRDRARCKSRPPRRPYPRGQCPETDSGQGHPSRSPPLIGIRHAAALRLEARSYGRERPGALLGDDDLGEALDLVEAFLVRHLAGAELILALGWPLCRGLALKVVLLAEDEEH